MVSSCCCRSEFIGKTWEQFIFAKDDLVYLTNDHSMNEIYSKALATVYESPSPLPIASSCKLSMTRQSARHHLSIQAGPMTMITACKQMPVKGQVLQLRQLARLHMLPSFGLHILHLADHGTASLIALGSPHCCI